VSPNVPGCIASPFSISVKLHQLLPLHAATPPSLTQSVRLSET